MYMCVSEDGSTNVEGSTCWDTFPVEQAIDAHSALSQGRANKTKVPSSTSEGAAAGAGTTPSTTDASSEGDGPLKSEHRSLESCLVLAVAENRRLKDANAALEALALEAAWMEGMMQSAAASAAPRLLPPLSPGPSLASVQAAFHEFVWNRGQALPEWVGIAFAKMPHAVIMGINSEFFDRLHAYAVEWTNRTEEGDRSHLAKSATAAIKVRNDFMLRLFTIDSGLCVALLPAVTHSAPGNPRGDRMLKKMAAVVQKIGVTAEQRELFRQAWEVYLANLQCINGAVVKAQQALTLALAEMQARNDSGLGNMHIQAERAIEMTKHAGVLRRCQDRHCLNYMVLAAKLKDLLTWVQYGLLQGAMQPFRPDLRQLCTLIIKGTN